MRSDGGNVDDHPVLTPGHSGERLARHINIVPSRLRSITARASSRLNAVAPFGQGFVPCAPMSPPAQLTRIEMGPSRDCTVSTIR